jgi:hypothetical protein
MQIASMKTGIAFALFLLLFLQSYLSVSQTDTPSNQELFELGLKEYLDAEALSQDEEAAFFMDDIELGLYYLNAIEILNQVNEPGDLGKSALYYSLLASHRLLAFDYFEMHDSSFLANSSELIKNFRQFKPEDFPFYFYYKDTRYSVSFSTMELDKSVLLKELSVSANRMQSFRLGYDYAKEALLCKSFYPVDRLLAYLNIGVSKEEFGEYDEELLLNSLQMMEDYLILSQNDKAEASSWLSDSAMADIVWYHYQKTSESHPLMAKNASYLQRLGSGLIKLNDPRAKDAFSFLLNQAGQLSQEQLLTIMTQIETKFPSLALLCADELLKRELNCSDYAQLISIYTRNNQSEKLKETLKKEEECQKKVARLARKANYVRPRLFLGTNPGQYLRPVENRDFTYEVGLMHKNRMSSVFYTQIKNNPYQMLDLYLNNIITPGFTPLWDGYKTGITIRMTQDKFENKKWTYYYDFQLAYAREQMQEFTDQVTDLTTLQQFTEVFAPIDNSYRFSLGLGSTYYWYVIGIDLKINFGLSLNTFDLRDQAILFTDQYSFENPLLTYRNGKTYHYGSLLNISVITYLIL